MARVRPSKSGPDPREPVFPRWKEGLDPSTTPTTQLPSPQRRHGRPQWREGSQRRRRDGGRRPLTRPRPLAADTRRDGVAESRVTAGRRVGPTVRHTAVAPGSEDDALTGAGRDGRTGRGWRLESPLGKGREGVPLRPPGDQTSDAPRTADHPHQSTPMPTWDALKGPQMWVQV